MWIIEQGAIHMNSLKAKSLKTKIIALSPAVLGLYCILQGSLLLGSEEVLIQLLGMGLFLWVPACGYFAWKGRDAWSPQVAVRTQPRRSTQPTPSYAQAVE
jgi:hypothetical protein